MKSNWNFFVPPEEAREQKIEKEKVPNKFLGWMSSLIKRKKNEPISLNLSRDEEAERIKQEIEAIPEENRAETESFLAEEISKIEERRESPQPTEESAAEPFVDKFEVGEKVIFSGERGWKVESTAAGQAEVGRMKKDPRGRDIYERKIVPLADIEKDLTEEKNELKKGEQILLNGEEGWEIVSPPGADGKYVEIGRVRADKKGTLVFERKIVDIAEVEKI